MNDLICRLENKPVIPCLSQDTKAARHYETGGLHWKFVVFQNQSLLACAPNVLAFCVAVKKINEDLQKQILVKSDRKQGFINNRKE